MRNQVNINETWALGNKRYDAQPVLLVPVSDEMQADEQLEPQFIRQRHGNLSTVFLDSFKDVSVSPSLSNVVITGNFFARKIQRFTVRSLVFNYFTPNINPNNDTLSIISSNTGSTIYNVPLIDGFYTNVTQLFTMIVGQLNSNTTGSGLTFTYLPDSDGTNRGIIFTTGGNYEFVSSSFILRGQNVLSIPFPDTLEQTKNLGPANFLYTRYIDILSLALTQYTKNPNATNTATNSNTLLTFPIISPAAGIITFNYDEPFAWINFNKSCGLQAIDLNLIDEFGLPLYIPSYAINFYFLLTLVAEL
jgi:hypothetical protein